MVALFREPMYHHLHSRVWTRSRYNVIMISAGLYDLVIRIPYSANATSISHTACYVGSVRSTSQVLAYIIL